MTIKFIKRQLTIFTLFENASKHSFLSFSPKIYYHSSFFVNKMWFFGIALEPA